jgi:hypothetical protein
MRSPLCHAAMRQGNGISIHSGFKYSKFFAQESNNSIAES